MAIRFIVKDPDPVLREIAKPVKEVNANVRKVLRDMAETMYDAHGVGLAAPQIGIAKRMIVLDPQDDETGLISMVNPVILHEEGEQLGPEGCLSIPGLNGEVKRKNKITVSGLNENGDKITIDAEGYLARIFQHEIDHLNGVLFTDIAQTIYKIPPVDAEE